MNNETSSGELNLSTKNPFLSLFSALRTEVAICCRFCKAALGIFVKFDLKSPMNASVSVPLASIHVLAQTEPPLCLTDEVLCFGS